MKQNLYLMSGVLLLLTIAGCSTTPTTTTTANETVNSNAEVAGNANTKQTNEAATTNETTNAAAENTSVDDNNANITGDVAVDTSDWLKYENEEYGFSFKYPKEWVLNESSTGVGLNSLDLVGSTYLNSVTLLITKNDFDAQKKEIENSDIVEGGVSLSKFNSDIHEVQLEELTATVGTHSTAIGLDEKYYYISLPNEYAVYFEFLKPTAQVNLLVDQVIKTLDVI